MNKPFFSRLFETNFLKNVSAMLVGSLIAQLLPILVSPLLSRIYTPHNFGSFAFFLSSCTIITILSTGYYEIAILKLKKQEEVLNLCFTIILISFSVCIFILLSIIIIFIFKAHFIKNTSLFEYIFIPLGIFLNSLFQITTYYLTWDSRFVLLNKIKVLQSIAIIIVSIGLGYSSIKEIGLIVSYIAGFSVSAIPLIYYIFTNRKKVDIDLITILVKKYLNYPLYVMPFAFINNLANQLPIFFIKKYFDKELVGEYSLTNRMLIAPVSIISVSLGQVYFKKISEKANKKESLTRSFYDSIILLSIISLIIFTPIYFFGENIIVFIFGNEWKTAGILSEILAIGILVKFVVSPLSTILFAISATKDLSRWQFLYFVSSITLFLLVPTSNFILFLKIYVAHEVILYSIYLFIMFINLKKYEASI